MKTLETIVPFFPGFYNSLLTDFIDREIDYELEENDKSYEEIEDQLDYRKAEYEISKQWLNVFNRETKLNLEMVEIDSPREYNYTTDRLVANISIEELFRIKKIVDENPNILQEVLNKHFTPRSGFIPFYSNDIKDWNKDVEDMDCNEIMCYIESYVMSEISDEKDLTYTIYDTSCVYEAAQYVWK